LAILLRIDISLQNPVPAVRNLPSIAPPRKMKMTNYLMYGYTNGIPSAKLKMEFAFQMHFEERHSSYRGNYFLYGSVNQLLLEIKEKNIDQIDGELWSINFLNIQPFSILPRRTISL
jgi:hypothetical protein